MSESPAPPNPGAPKGSWARSILAQSKLARVFQYGDFRLLWMGAFISFTGSWIQNVAQGFFVFQLTGDEKKLSIVSFAWSIPVLLFGLLAGTLVDVLDKRRTLIVAQTLYGCTAFYLAAATYYGFVEYWHIVLIAFVNGMIACVEMPTRQSMVSQVVPLKDLAAAVPINAMTFNVARIVGPALGGLLLKTFDVAGCYLANGLSFIGLVSAALAIKADLRAPKREPQPVLDLISEGFLYTIRDARLRTLFVLETLAGMFGLSYVPLLPAYVKEHLGMTERAAAAAGLAQCFTAVGIGAMAGLLIVSQFSETRYRTFTIRTAIFGLGLGLIGLSLVRSTWLVLPLLSLTGMCTLMQFNTTNALFQLLSPARLRGRVLAMHIWSMNGLSPFGVLLAGWMASESRLQGFLPFGGWRLSVPVTGPALPMLVGGTIVVVAAVFALVSPHLARLSSPEEA